MVAASAANPTNFMVGQVTGYTTVGSVATLTLNATVVGGAGTHADWTLALSGAPSPAIPLGASSIEFLFDGGGAPLAPGFFGYLEVPFNCTIVRSTLAANGAGNAQADIWRVPPGSFPPTIANSIVAADPPMLAASAFSQDVILSGWSTGLNAGDILAFVLVSASSISQLTLSLGLAR